jgi:hypothetical protein
VIRKLSVLVNMPTAARLPSAEAFGASGLAAISEPITISVMPMSLASLRSPNVAASRANGGLEAISGRMFSTS